MYTSYVYIIYIIYYILRIYIYIIIYTYVVHVCMCCPYSRCAGGLFLTRHMYSTKASKGELLDIETKELHLLT